MGLPQYPTAHCQWPMVGNPDRLKGDMQRSPETQCTA